MDLLEIAFEDGGPDDGRPVLLIHGWPDAPWDSRYDPLQRKLREVGALSRPTLMIQGASDYCDPPSLSEGLERYFTRRYNRVLLDGLGHFPHRESPAAVAAAILRHLVG